jgi:hypothetical protein
MKVQLAIIAQSSSVDRFTNRLSIFNVLETLEAPSFPLFIAEAVFVSVLRKEEGDSNTADGTLTIRAGDTTVGHTTIRIDFESSQHSRQIITFQGIPVLTPQNLEFQLAVNGRVMHVLEIPVSKVNPIQAQPVSAVEKH